MTSPNADASRFLTLTIACPDRVGIVAKVATFISENGGWIEEANHHADSVSRMFFMRNVIRASSLPFDQAEFVQRFAPIASDFEMKWALHDSASRKRIVVLVSRADHCLVDLLHRAKTGELGGDIVAVISNHPTLANHCEWAGVPFHHIPMDAESKARADTQICGLFDQYRGDLMVLARYMQIMPPEVCSRYEGRIINIHHSFLPSFKGAMPYHQAFERGVKLIGATCHYVTPSLDQGPIIEQDVVRIDHSDSVQDLVVYGKDIERQVLARGIKYHLEDRVLLNGDKTVVFR
jgi:formyltetrahydrofolate deformylase